MVWQRETGPVIFQRICILALAIGLTVTKSRPWTAAFYVDALTRLSSQFLGLNLLGKKDETKRVILTLQVKFWREGTGSNLPSNSDLAG